jgi:hypothetical protein
MLPSEVLYEHYDRKQQIVDHIADGTGRERGQGRKHVGTTK